eukprot:3736185-Rhodomonas_salina.2
MSNVVAVGSRVWSSSSPMRSRRCEHACCRLRIFTDRTENLFPANTPQPFAHRRDSYIGRWRRSAESRERFWRVPTADGRVEYGVSRCRTVRFRMANGIGRQWENPIRRVK